MAMSATTAEAVVLAVENLLLRGDLLASDLALCILLGVERSSPVVFWEYHCYVIAADSDCSFCHTGMSFVIKQRLYTPDALRIQS